MICSYCHTSNAAGEQYCASCGALLVASAALSYTASGAATSAPSGPATFPTALQGGRYVLRKLLGQGGMGMALLMADARLNNKLVVVKALNATAAADPVQFQEDLQNFRREVNTLADLDHPLVPQVTDHFQEGLFYYMVQAYVDGENLEERLSKRKGPLDEREVLGLALEMLGVLDYLHTRQPPIIHRDIKPANIIVRAKDGQAYLVDFGIARAITTQGTAVWKQTAALGTPGYAPPEQYQGKAEPRSDLYALAATMHHLLTNRDPRDYNPFAYPPVRSLNPLLSPEVEGLLTRSLEMDPGRRFQDAAQMRQEVERLLRAAPGGTGYQVPPTIHPAPTPVNRQETQAFVAPSPFFPPEMLTPATNRPPSGAATPTTAPLVFPCPSQGVPEVQVERLSAEVQVMPHRKSQIEVRLLGTDEARREIRVGQEGSQVIIRGTGARTGGGGSTIIQSGPGFQSVTRLGRGSVVINSGGNISIVNGQVIVDGKPITPGSGGSEPAADATRVLVMVPYGSSITMDEVEEGPITIGDVRGKIGLSLASASAHVESTTGGSVEIHENGSAVIDQADCDVLSLSCHANGGITVSRGHIEMLTCLSHANGAIMVHGSARKSRLESYGNGPIYLHVSKEPPVIRRRGNGRVQVGNHPNA